MVEICDQKRRLKREILSRMRGTETPIESSEGRTIYDLSLAAFEPIIDMMLFSRLLFHQQSCLEVKCFHKRFVRKPDTYHLQTEL